MDAGASIRGGPGGADRCTDTYDIENARDGISESRLTSGVSNCQGIHASPLNSEGEQARSDGTVRAPSFALARQLSFFSVGSISGRHWQLDQLSLLVQENGDR